MEIFYENIKERLFKTARVFDIDVIWWAYTQREIINVAGALLFFNIHAEYA